MKYSLMLAFQLLIAINCRLAHASVYPLLTDPNTDVLMIDNTRVDEAVRLAIIRRAKYSIDVSSHTQTSTGFGFKAIRAMQERMKAGVRLRYIYERFAGLGIGEYTDRSARLLTDSSFYNPENGSEIITCRLGEKLWSPFGYFELFHEKVTIVDQGTPDEVMIIGGRNYDTTASNWSDFSFVLRPIDPSKPYAGTQIFHHFEKMLALAKRYYQPEKPRTPSVADLDWQIRQEVSEGYAMRLAPSNATAAKRIIEVVARRPGENDILRPFQFRPSTAQVITNDILKLIAESRQKSPNALANPFTQEDINRFIEEKINQSDSVEFTSYIIDVADRIKNALRALLRRGGDITFNTNSAATFGSVFPIGYLGNYANALNIEAYFDILGNARPGQLVVNQLDLERGKKQRDPVVYHHRRAIVLRKAGMVPTVITGSSNYTNSSETKNSEFILAMTDERLADYVQAINRRDCEAMFTRLTLSQALELLGKYKFGAKITRSSIKAMF